MKGYFEKEHTNVDRPLEGNPFLKFKIKFVWKIRGTP